MISSPLIWKEVMNLMSDYNKNKHLTPQDRIIIETGIRNGSTKTAIADTLGKDKSTIGKEISLHRVLKHKCRLPLECSHYKKCSFDRHCSMDCPDFARFTCKRRDRSPGACNGCDKFSYCRFNKYVYSASDADHDYRISLVDSRQGVNLTFNEAKDMADIVVPLIEKGQSPYQIIIDHPELNICEKTLYNYIECGVFERFGLHNVDLRIKVKRKVPKNKKNAYKKRQDKKYLKGRKYDDYVVYMGEYPYAAVVQMDTVYNDGSYGPYMQTFLFMDFGFIFAIYHNEKTAKAMKEGIEILEGIIGKDLFDQCVEVLLTDRGSEFSNPEAMESRNDGTQRTRVYYCDPMQSGQKGKLENKHRELRYILPKDTNLHELGLTGQDRLNTVLSHVNSTPVQSLKGKSPIEMMRFLNPDLLKKFNDYGIIEIEKDKIVLKPYLLKK